MANGSHDGLQPAEAALPSAATATEAELERVLSSQTFSKAPTLRTLLDYLASPRGASAREYAIATEALGRRADFDPSIVVDGARVVQISLGVRF
jgi:hypothetical protein